MVKKSGLDKPDPHIGDRYIEQVEHIDSLEHFSSEPFTISDENELENLSSPGILNPATMPVKTSRFYGGVIAGVSVSNVKDYRYKKPGYEVGVFGGFQFANRLAVEIGVIRSQKHYMVRGENFDLKNLGSMMQPGMKMMLVDGSTGIVEIPVQIRFNVLQSAKKVAFLKAGLSSFILLHEQNSYHTYYNGSDNMLYGNYKENHLYGAAAINLALGYEAKINDRIKLRIEPFIQIPIKKVGIGTLPIKTAGIRAGFSRVFK